MRGAYIWALILAMIAIVSVASVAFDSENVNAEDTESYKLTYYGELEGEVLFNQPYVVEANSMITLHTQTDEKYGDYAQAGWSYNGVVYELGNQFIMPHNDVTLTAVWESDITLAANVELSQKDTTTITLIVCAIFAIAAIIGTITIQTMRKNAMKDL